MQHVRLKINGPTGVHAETFEVDGQPVKDARHVTIDTDHKEITEVAITYTCREFVDFDGEAKVSHHCPLTDMEALDEPRLGLATTKQLLDELRARIETAGQLEYRTVGE